MSYVTPISDQNALTWAWPLHFLLRQDRQTLTLTSTCYFDFIEVNWNQDGLKGKPGSRILKTIVAISNFGNRITSTQTFLLSASSEKTKTITTTLRLLFYVSILWGKHWIILPAKKCNGGYKVSTVRLPIGCIPGPGAVRWAEHRIVKHPKCQKGDMKDNF